MRSKKLKVVKEPGLFKKLIGIYTEQARRRKELRRLSKQSWSIDFLSVLLAKTAKLAGEGITMVIANKDGVSITLNCDQARRNSEHVSDDILNNLDDDMAVMDFINKYGRR